METPKQKAIAVLLIIGVTVVCALLAALCIYDAVHGNKRTQPMAIFAATMFAGLTLRMMVTPWIAGNHRKVVPVLRERIQTPSGEEAAFRSVDLPSPNEARVIIGLIVLFAGMVMLVQTLREGLPGGVGTGSGNNLLAMLIVLLAGSGIFTAAFLKKTPGRGGISLSPSGVLWAEPTVQPIFVAWGQVESIELLLTTPKERKHGEIPTVGLRLRNLPVYTDRDPATRQRLQENRERCGCELLLPQTQMAAPIAEIKLAVDSYREDTESRARI